jgi:hypothetical protein
MRGDRSHSWIDNPRQVGLQGELITILSHSSSEGVKALPRIPRQQYGILTAAAYFDVHQSGTAANIAPQADPPG